MAINTEIKEISTDIGTGTRTNHNPLLGPITEVLERIVTFKAMAREFYLEVSISAHTCPACGGRFQMAGPSKCTCRSCGITLDPTVEFQKSGCCRARLVKCTCHYVCSQCRKVVPSKYLFDERVFDRNYFREMMKASRDRARKRKEAVRQLLVESRSGSFTILDSPYLESVPGLIEALDSFIKPDDVDSSIFVWNEGHTFHIDQYQNLIVNNLGWSRRLFSSFPALHQESRRDRVYRFIALIFMQQENEVKLTQHSESDVWVERVYHENDQ